jgi:hypothetical protein
MTSEYLIITLGKDHSTELKFRIRPTALSELWLDRMQQRYPYPLDHADRFYGFDDPAKEKSRATSMIQNCINIINTHEHIIEREFEYTQDCLNYLHNIFEKYHGLLDQQTSDYWLRAPEQVRVALAELNLAVHRCEDAAGLPLPRMVCTWFGLPKTHCLSKELQREYGETLIKFGTVYLNYCEIGKTVDDLAYDNDIYISDEAFRPFGHYSADFNVAFHDRDATERYPQIQNYIEQHSDFFLAKGITSVYNIQAQPLYFPVADLEYSGDQIDLIQQIRDQQFVREVKLQ